MNRNRLVNELVKVGKRAVTRYLRDRNGRNRGPEEPQFSDPRGTREARYHPSRREEDYPGDYTQEPRIEYTPVKDDMADPGEVVWTWVPYEEDFSQGKDRPVLVIGRDGPWLLALQTSTVNDAAHRKREANQGRHWMDIGSGEWDSRGRESEVRVNRILRIDPDAVRRVGARLSREIFDDVAREVKRHY